MSGAFISRDELVAFFELGGRPFNRRLSTARELRFGRHGALSVDVRTGRWFDHEAGVGGDLIAFARTELGATSFAEACRMVRSAGVDPDIRAPALDREQVERDQAATARAFALWMKAKPLTGECEASRYLIGRAIPPPWPASLRCGGDWNAEVRRMMWVLVAAVTSADAPFVVRAVQRTFLADGCKAEVPTPKKALGPIGGGGVVLGDVAEAVVVAEGVETALSAGRAFGLPAIATLGAGNLAALNVPATVRRVVIAADRDPGGVGERAARSLGERLSGRHVEASIAWPPEPFKDFNDYAQAKAALETSR